MGAIPAYVQQALVLQPGVPAGLQLFALYLVDAGVAAPQVKRQALQRAVGHAVNVWLHATQGEGGALQHRPGQAPHWPQQPSLQWSLSYAWPVALWGVSTEMRWGVDIEALPEIDDAQSAHYAELAHCYLESDALPMSTLQGSAGPAAFAAQWCALEAQLKCAGLALTETVARSQHWNAGLRSAPITLAADWNGYAAALAWRESNA